MKTKSLFISSEEINAGTLFISMGMMEILKRNIHRVAFFRPIISNKNREDQDINFMREHYNLEISYEESYGYDVAYVEEKIASNEINILMNNLISKFKHLEKNYDFILCEGIRRSFLTPIINFDINIKIAQNFGSSYINIINAKNRDIQDIYQNILLHNKNILSYGCSHFATFVNRIESKIFINLEKKLKSYPLNTYLLKELEELSLLHIDDIIEALNPSPILFSDYDHTRHIRAIKIAGLGVDNFLAQIEEDDLVIVSADRSDIILALFASLSSRNYPNISAIIFPFSMTAHPNIQKLIEGLKSFNIPILSVPYDTYTTIHKLSKIHSRIRPNSSRKIALSLGLFNASVDSNYIEKKIFTSQNNIITPMMFQYKLFDMASQNKKIIILPESKEVRILRAVEIIIHRGVANIILLGKEEEIKEHYLQLGLDLSQVKIIDHLTSPLKDKFSEVFYEMRKKKGLTLQGAKEAMTHSNYFATMMVHLGYADGMVSGAIHTTGDTIRPALQIIKTMPSLLVVSSLFFMCLETKVLVYADCAINQEPDAKTLADIAISSARTAKLFSIEPKVAMLSYATGESSQGIEVDKVREATKIAKLINPELMIEGPIQYDAAVIQSVAKSKLPHSKIKGEANILIFPNLNTGNNTYKAVQRSSGAVAIGPILQGLNKPINDLSRGCLVEDIVNTIAITAIQAGELV